jgi:hypothetical protein
MRPGDDQLSGVVRIALEELQDLSGRVDECFPEDEGGALSLGRFLRTISTASSGA